MLERRKPLIITAVTFKGYIQVQPHDDSFMLFR